MHARLQCVVSRGDIVPNPVRTKRRKCTHEHWKNCQDYPEAHTWVLGQPAYSEEEEEVRALVWAQADGYPEAEEEDYAVEEDEALCIRQLIPERPKKMSRVEEEVKSQVTGTLVLYQEWKIMEGSGRAMVGMRSEAIPDS
ncbi:hypothetical protein EI94DRAFT_1709903 [Lactarius quietus]|nr:hypothetical protein EI94DRAFT_1709903 [Lactarius quietus]